MEMQNIITLIKAVSESNLTSFQYEEGNLRLSFETANGAVLTENSKNIDLSCVSESEQTEQDAEEELKKDSLYITSPMVGTYYTAASEDSEPFINVGDLVKIGQVVGIVEAMKLMNEIKSPYEGVVDEILVNNKSMIGFGETLIKLHSR